MPSTLTTLAGAHPPKPFNNPAPGGAIGTVVSVVKSILSLVLVPLLVVNTTSSGAGSTPSGKKPVTIIGHVIAATLSESTASEKTRFSCGFPSD